VLDPTPLPPHAVIPELNIQSWQEWSASVRSSVTRAENLRLLADAWGARGVYVGSDMPTEEWAARGPHRTRRIFEHPRMLQRFVKGALAKQDYVAENDEIVTLTGRAPRLPYYFVSTTRHPGRRPRHT